MSNPDTFKAKAAKVALGVLLMALVSFAIGFSLVYFLDPADSKYRFSEAAAGGLIMIIISFSSGLLYIKWWR